MFKTIPLIMALLAGLNISAVAGVQVTRFDPPLNISALATVTAPNQLFNVLPLDFNLDGFPDFNFAYGADSFGLGGIEVFMNVPDRIVVKQPLEVAAVPLGTVIGSRLSLPAAYQWSDGYTNEDGVTQPLGDHELSVITVPNVIPSDLSNGGGPILVFGPGGTLSPLPPPQFPLVEGDVVGKAGVMAVEFYINDEPHYGYIQFDFRKSTSVFSGMDGLIYGWAYETEPGVPIVAVPLNDQRDNGPDRSPRF
jgi:hypothetical protein